MHEPHSYLVPEHLDAGEHGAGGDEPAVAQLALCDVTGAYAVHEQAWLLTDLLRGGGHVRSGAERNRRGFSHISCGARGQARKMTERENNRGFSHISCRWGGRSREVRGREEQARLLAHISCGG